MMAMEEPLKARIITLAITLVVEGKRKVDDITANATNIVLAMEPRSRTVGIVVTDVKNHCSRGPRHGAQPTAINLFSSGAPRFSLGHGSGNLASGLDARHKPLNPIPTLAGYPGTNPRFNPFTVPSTSSGADYYTGLANGGRPNTAAVLEPYKAPIFDPAECLSFHRTPASGYMFELSAANARIVDGGVAIKSIDFGANFEIRE